MSWFKSARTTEHGYFEERISAYLDGELTPQEYEAVEHHLETCPECQWELETLRQTTQWARELPKLTVPRVFTIPVAAEPERVARRRWNFLPVLQGATALIAVLLVFAVGGDLLLNNAPVGRAPDAAYQQEVASIEMEATKIVEKAVEEPAAEPEMMVVETVVETVEVEGEAMATQTQEPLALGMAPTEAPAAAESMAPAATPQAPGTEDAWRGIEGGEVSEEVRPPEADAELPLLEEEAMAGGGEPTLALPEPSSLLSMTEPSTVGEQLAMAPEMERNETADEAAASNEPGINWLRVLEYSLGGALLLLAAVTIVFTIERRRSQ